MILESSDCTVYILYSTIGVSVCLWKYSNYDTNETPNCETLGEKKNGYIILNESNRNFSVKIETDRCTVELFK